MTQIDENYSPKLLLGLESLWREQTFVDTTLVFGIGCTFGLSNVKTGSVTPHSQFVLTHSILFHCFRAVKMKQK